MKKLPRKLADVLYAFFLTLAMVLVVSGVSTAIALGFPSDFLWRWAKAWLTAWLIAFPAAYLIAPRVRKLVDSLVD